MKAIIEVDIILDTHTNTFRVNNIHDKHDKQGRKRSRRDGASQPAWKLLLRTPVTQYRALPL
jgi:hypothetical protein